MTTEHERATFERAAAFRRGLAAYLGLPDGKDPDHVGITLGSGDEPTIGMPLSIAERLLTDAQRERPPMTTVAGTSSHDERVSIPSIGRALAARMGREVTLIVLGLPPMTGFVTRLVERPADDGAPFVVISTDAHSDVEVRLRDVVEIKAWSA